MRARTQNVENGVEGSGTGYAPIYSATTMFLIQLGGTLWPKVDRWCNVDISTARRPMYIDKNTESLNKIG